MSTGKTPTYGCPLQAAPLSPSVSTRPFLAPFNHSSRLRECLLSQIEVNSGLAHPCCRLFSLHFVTTIN